MALQDWSGQEPGFERRAPTHRAGWPLVAFLAREVFKDFNVLKIWRFRARSRAELGQLSERQLRDIGLTYEQAMEEAGKPFWRA